MKHELLKKGDIIKEGDEYWDTRHMRWVRSIESIGRGVGTYDVFRRHITDKPKVRLGAFMEFLCEDIFIHRNRVEEVAKSICTHLGIELEPEKEEWERAHEEALKYTDPKTKEEKDYFKEGIRIGFHAAKGTK